MPDVNIKFDIRGRFDSTVTVNGEVRELAPHEVEYIRDELANPTDFTKYRETLKKNYKRYYIDKA